MQQRVVFRPGDAAAAGGEDDAGALALLRQCCRQIDTGGGFAHAAFLVYDGNDFCHRPPAFRATALFDARHKCRGALRCNDSANSIITRSLRCFKAFL